MSAPDRPPHVVLDARPLAGQFCGYTIYLCSIIASLRDAGFTLTLLSNSPLRPCFEEAEGLPVHVFGTSSNLGWEQRSLPEWLATSDADVYFTAANRGIPLRKNNRIRYILGLLDVIPYLFWRGYFLPRWKTLVKHPSSNAETVSQLISVARADAILTISQQSAIDIKRLFRRRDVTAHLIRLKDIDVRDVPIDPDLADSSYFTYVGGFDYRKQVDVLLQAFASFAQRHSHHRLVLVGSNYPPLEPRLQELGIADRVSVTGHVDHNMKFAILRRGTAMVYPSLYEGYGLAIAEGFQAQVPVIAGRGGSQAEIGGDGVRVIDPLSPLSIAAAMEEMLYPVIHSRWIAMGQAQLARLTDPAIERGTIDYFANEARIARQR